MAGAAYRTSSSAQRRLVSTMLERTTLRSLIRRFLRTTSAASSSAEASSTSDSAKFELDEYALHRASPGPARVCSCNSEQALQLQRSMQMVRSVETAAAQLFRQKCVRGMLHIYSGQEATCVGIRAAMSEVDSVITTYRCHGWALMMGVSAREVLTAVTGRATSRHKGKGGSMHMYNPDKLFFGGSGIIGAQCPLGAGIGLAHKYLGTGGVSFTMYGEGAANQGQLSEAMNMAALWKLPVVFVCENNHYSYYTAEAHVTADRHYYSRSDVVPGIKVDGMDVLAVREAARWAVEHAREGHGPVVLESATYRFSGHSVADSGTFYRPSEEVQEAKAHDPILLFRRRILEAGLVTEEQLKNVNKEIQQEVEDAVQAAVSDPEVTADGVAHDILVDDLGYKEVRGVSPFQPLRHETSRDVP